MSPEEHAPRTGGTAWRVGEVLDAGRGERGPLLLISFHRRMASSLAAFAESLQRVAQRLRDRLARRGHTVSDDGAQFLRQMAADLEDDEDFESSDSEGASEATSPEPGAFSETDE